MRLSIRSKNYSSVSANGFTIIELLVVIVIIAILVSIVIIGYIGITTQANNSKYKANAESIAKVAETRGNDESSDSYPTDIASFTSTHTKLPDGVSIKNTESSATTDNPPSITAIETDAKNGIYSVNFCDGGLIIFYPVIGQTNANYITVGHTTSC